MVDTKISSSLFVAMSVFNEKLQNFIHGFRNELSHNLTYLLLDADRIYKIMQNETFLSFVYKFALDCIFSNEYSYNFKTYMVVLSVQNEIKLMHKIIIITLTLQ